jgi:hypothetical protein
MSIPLNSHSLYQLSHLMIIYIKHVDMSIKTRKNDNFIQSVGYLILFNLKKIKFLYGLI